ncbi:MAG TPA: thiolase family protein [Stellaceae bacterium]|nr:thiolase family protein [Stellaceae bacterium]
MSWIVGVGDTPCGRLEGESALSLMAKAAAASLENAGFERGEIDGLLCGYSGTMPHLMLSTVFAEYFGLKPRYAHAIQLGGATGGALTMLAGHLVAAGACERVLVVAGDNRLTGQGRDEAVKMLAQVGHHQYEVPFGPTIPAYYGLVASRYRHVHGGSDADFAEFAVLMRRHAGHHPGAHLRDPITVDDVLASRVIASPLKLLDCCPVSDGAAALVVSNKAEGRAPLRLAGSAQAHPHQHVSFARDLADFGLQGCAEAARRQAGVGIKEVDLLGIYDSFTITVAILLEETGFAPRGQAGALAREGVFGRDGPTPLNTHGGLLSFGHSGVAGGLCHLVEVFRQMAGEAGARQLTRRKTAFVHGDGGVLSSHVSLVLRAE